MIPLFHLLVSLSFLFGESSLSEQSLYFNDYEYDFGEIPYETQVSHSFLLKNMSHDDISILSVSSSCRCTSTTWTEGSISSMKEGAVVVHFSPKGKTGSFKEKIFVYFSNNERIILTIKGFVRKKNDEYDQYLDYSPLLFEKDTINLGLLAQESTRKRIVKIYNPTNMSVHLVFKTEGNNVDYSINPNPIAPKEEANLMITVNASHTEIGEHRWRITPIINGVQHNALIAQAKIIYNDDYGPTSGRALIKVKNKVKSFGKTRRGRRRISLFKLSNTGSIPLTIYKVESSKTIRTAYKKTIKPGRSSFLIVWISTDSLTGSQSIPISIYTNAHNKPLQRVFVTGFVK